MYAIYIYETCRIAGVAWGATNECAHKCFGTMADRAKSDHGALKLLIPSDNNIIAQTHKELKDE